MTTEITVSVNGKYQRLVSRTREGIPEQTLVRGSEGGLQSPTVYEFNLQEGETLFVSIEEAEDQE